MLGPIRAHLTGTELIIDSVFLLVLLLVSLRPRLGGSAFRKIETVSSQLSRKRAHSILAVGLFPIIIRLCLLPLMPCPVPEIHDEFSYLLAADTFAHGRLTNPPHPMALFLDTIHVNQQPTYMSKYPPAQGMMLAFGQVTTGYPWAGVLLSVGAMCSAVLWMLQGWLPPPWALLGATLVVLRIGIFSYWMNSYWGGAVPAVGGALVLGALPRILRSHRVRDSAVMGAGAGILVHSRPLEGFVLCFGVAISLVLTLIVKRSPSLRILFSRIVVPCGLLVLLSIAVAGCYNRRLTGSVFLTPYVLNEHRYWSTPTLLWQTPRSPIHFSNPQFEAFYNVWSRNLWLETSNSVPKRAAIFATKFVYFFCWPELCVPLLGVGLLLRDKRTRFLLFQVSLSFGAFLFVAWFQPHYAAAVISAVFALFVQALRHLKTLIIRGRPIGTGIVRVVLVFSLLLSPFHAHSVAFRQSSKGDARAMIEAQLESSPGKHLVIVQYSIDHHDPLCEWVYNRADIDDAKTVWAREIPGVSLSPLLDYFRGRRVWVVEADSARPQLIPFVASSK